MSDPHSLNTNLVGSDSVPVIIAQDVAAGYFAGEILENPKGVVKFGKESAQLLGKAGSKLAKGGAKGGAKVGAFLAKGPGMKALTKALKNKTNKLASSAIIKGGSALAVKLGAKASAMGATMATKYAAIAPAMAPCPPCGAALMAAQLAFDITNIVLDIMDTQNYNVIMDRKTVNEMAAMYQETMKSIYDQADMPEALTEEVLFYPEQFVFQYDEDGNLFMNDEYGEIYNEYVNEYMKLKGFPDNWREETDKNAQELEKQSNTAFSGTNENQQTLLIIIFIIIIIIILLLMISKKNGTKNSI